MAAQKIPRKRRHAKVPVFLIDAIGASAQIRYIVVAAWIAVQSRQHFRHRAADQLWIIVLHRQAIILSEVALRMAMRERLLQCLAER